MVKFSTSITCLLIFIVSTGNAQAFMEKTTVWSEKENNIFSHFVYGLTVTSKGSILAFAEARIDKGADDGAHHIVMKRSTDQGRTFSVSKVLVESKNGESWTNPTVVQDSQTKRIFLFYALNHENVRTQVFYKSSMDDGLSWSSQTEITTLFSENNQRWTFHLPGPGHGIQIKNKRMILPIWHRRSISNPPGQRNYGVTCVYSDDNGITWQTGGSTPVGEFNESQIVAQKNGHILLIGRTITGKSGSFQAKVWSTDQGETWSQEFQYDTALTGRVCDIGLTNLPWLSKTLLVSQPADPEKRSKLTIRLSKDDGATWPVSKLLEEGSSTYSDLAVLPDKSIICLYGNGDSGHMPEKVSLARFNMDWLLQNPK